jgi:hypothetical protein
LIAKDDFPRKIPRNHRNQPSLILLFHLVMEPDLEHQARYANGLFSPDLTRTQIQLVAPLYSTAKCGFPDRTFRLSLLPIEISISHISDFGRLDKTTVRNSKALAEKAHWPIKPADSGEGGRAKKTRKSQKTGKSVKSENREEHEISIY